MWYQYISPSWNSGNLLWFRCVAQGKISLPSEKDELQKILNHCLPHLDPALLKLSFLLWKVVNAVSLRKKRWGTIQPAMRAKFKIQNLGLLVIFNICTNFGQHLLSVMEQHNYAHNNKGERQWHLTFRVFQSKVCCAVYSTRLTLILLNKMWWNQLPLIWKMVLPALCRNAFIQEEQGSCLELMESLDLRG